MKIADLIACYEKYQSLAKTASAARSTIGIVKRKLKAAGVKLNKKGGNRYVTATGSAVRVQCNEPHLPKPRMCVMKDYKDSCTACVSRYKDQGLRNSSTMDAEIRGTWAGREDTE